MKSNLKKIAKVILFLGILCTVLWGVTKAVLPKIPDFYKEDEWDVVFFGTSAAYCSFNPTVFDEYDLKSYNRGRQQQPINYTYYYIKDALDASEIDVVVLETFALTYWEGYELYTDAGVRDSSFNDLRYSAVKYEAIKDCIPKEQQRSYMFPLDKYHSNWERFDYSSLSGLWNSLTNPYYTEDSERGYYAWNAIHPIKYMVNPGEPLSEKKRDIYGFNLKYLELIYEACQEAGAELVMVRVPLPVDGYIVETMNTLQNWADEKGVEFINYMAMTGELDMDWNQDCLDEGSHLNVYGAEKVSRHLAEYLKKNYFAGE